MLRATLLALALASTATVSPGCAPHVKAELELGRPLRLLPVEDPRGALAAVVAAVRADPDAGLDVDEHTVSASVHRPTVHELFVTGPEKHVLEDYIRTHPELAAPAGYQFGYERQIGPDQRPRWRLHCLREGGHELRRLVSAALAEEDDGPRIRVRLDAHDGAAFGRLTAQHLGGRLAVVQDGEVLMAPVILEPITGGGFDLSLGGVRTRGEAEAALERLLSR